MTWQPTKCTPSRTQQENLGGLEGSMSELPKRGSTVASSPAPTPWNGVCRSVTCLTSWLWPFPSSTSHALQQAHWPERRTGHPGISEPSPRWLLSFIFEHIQLSFWGILVYVIRHIHKHKCFAEIPKLYVYDSLQVTVQKQINWCTPCITQQVIWSSLSAGHRARCHVKTLPCPRELPQLLCECAPLCLPSWMFSEVPSLPLSTSF